MPRKLVPLYTLKRGERFFDVNGVGVIRNEEHMVLEAPRQREGAASVTPLTGSAAGCVWNYYGNYEVAVEAAPERGERG